MKFKEMKKIAKQNIKSNYIKNLLLVFICGLLMSGGFNFMSNNILDVDISKQENVRLLNMYDKQSNSDALNEILHKTEVDKKVEKYVSNEYNQGVLSKAVNEVFSNRSFTFSILNGLNKILGGAVSVAVVIIVANLVFVVIKILFISVLEIGRNRYFLEQRRYEKTNMDRLLYSYKSKKNFSLAWILFVKSVYLFLWSITIVGWFIKYYEYRMIPYVLAENPNIKRKEAFKLSKELMRGDKFNLFKLHLSLIGWKILGLLTFNLLNIFFTNIYIETLHTEFYATMRKEKLNKISNNKLLNDEKLYIDEKVDEPYSEKTKHKTIFNVDVNKAYSLTTYILFFFTFSLFGWLWEVFLHIVDDGTFVNRGTLYGPWIPIYGIGGVAILFLLKRFRKKPWQMFVASIVLCAVIEYSSAWILETFKHLKYWYYSGYFLNIQGRICAEGLLVFGLAGCAFTYLFAPLLDNLYDKINIKIRKVLCIFLVVIFAFDLIYATFINPNTGEGITTEIHDYSK